MRTDSEILSNKSSLELLASLCWPTERMSATTHALDQIPAEAPTRQTSIATNESEQEGLYLVFLNAEEQGADDRQAIQGILEEVEIETVPTEYFDKLRGFSIRIRQGQAEQLRNHPRINTIEKDRLIYVEPEPTPDPTPTPEPQTAAPNALIAYQDQTLANGEILPWGVQAVWNGLSVSSLGNIGAGKYLFVIDSGVIDTGDINLNTNWSRSWTGESPFSDGIGHGTHVAHTAAALVNGRGVVGVAPGMNVTSLKVFTNSGGGGNYSWIVSAVDYILGLVSANNLNANDVIVNMSLGGPLNASLDTAIRTAANTGIKFAIAAGNSGADADSFSPASTGDHPNVYVVSAVNKNYQMASWSNWDNITGGDDVDFSMPGVDILSYTGVNRLGLMSGTSMGSPHMAGLLGLGDIVTGDMVTPYGNRQADPFAYTSLAFNQPGPGGGSSSTSFALAGPSFVNEGETGTFTLTTSGLTAPIQAYWELSGVAANTVDISSALSGFITINQNGTTDFQINATADLLTEGNETVTLTLYSDTTRANSLAAATTTISDTSQTPSLGNEIWGTTNSESINGTATGERITGVLSTGTSGTAMGQGQVDILTGNGGGDTYLLGDSRGVFYDDRNARSNGANDYAEIRGFNLTEDKIQLRTGSYFQRTSVGNTSIYWDQNGNNRLDNRDELLATIIGVQSLNSSQHISWA